MLSDGRARAVVSRAHWLGHVGADKYGIKSDRSHEVLAQCRHADQLWMGKAITAEVVGSSKGCQCAAYWLWTGREFASNSGPLRAILPETVLCSELGTLHKTAACSL